MYTIKGCSSCLCVYTAVVFACIFVRQAAADKHWDYIVIGAGPAGLQLGYFLEQAGRDYMVLEQSNSSGNFFNKYPRHERLISINKRHTGKSNKEFNLRHDWNSLLSHDHALLMKHYSKDMFPDKRVYLKYLDDYQRRLDIKVQFSTRVHGIVRTQDTPRRFLMLDQHRNVYTCSYLIVATGIFKPNIPSFRGLEFTEGYEDISTDPEDYEGQTVLILGRGNSAFEVADSIYGSTNLIHMLGRSRIRLSWATHYVGDLRAINNGLLDTYQLKSLDGVVEAPVDKISIKRDEAGKLWVDDLDSVEVEGEESNHEAFDNFAMRDSYDRVIRCLGFSFDDSIFTNTTTISRAKGKRKKYPLISHDYQSVEHEHLYFAGTNTHSLDFRQSAGGFIHGFRYTVRALHHLLEWRNHGVLWPSTTQSIDQLLLHLVKRMNEASGTYQMFGILGDVVAIRAGGTEFDYFEEFPIRHLHKFTEHTGVVVEQLLVLVMEYGYEFSGATNDPFREDRATGEPSDAHRSNFLHPVLYYFRRLPTDTEMSNIKKKNILPRPAKLHHVVEDFLTDFTAPTSHILPLRRFIEDCVDFDTRHVFAEDCMRLILTHTSVPYTCKQYLAGVHGLMAGESNMKLVESQGLLI